jgi:hypothetical protein
MSTLAVTLTVEQLADLVRAQVAAELAKLPTYGAKEVLNLQEVAELLDRHPRSIKGLIDEKGLPVHFISDREPRFKRAEVLAWLDTLPNRPAQKAA